MTAVRAKIIGITGGIVVVAAATLAAVLTAIPLPLPVNAQQRDTDAPSTKSTPSTEPVKSETESERAAADTDADSKPTFTEQIGLDAAQARLGDAMPTGRGVPMGHVEGGRDQYMPDRDRAQFKNVTLKARSGDSKAFGHTTHTAGLIYGNDALAPGVDTVHHFATRHWLTDGFLRSGQPVAPRDEPVRVWTHSWITDNQRGEDNDRPLAHALRRVDYAIDAQGTVMCVGVNNNRASRVPALLASAYNVISVGAQDGASSGGYTRIEGEGRCKPELIVPKSRTSFATPVVAAAAARLIERADAMQPGAPHADRPEVIKAALLAGAVKPWHWEPEPGKPLDEHRGAGRLHVDNALRILEAGAQVPGAPAAVPGWDYGTLKTERSNAYTFDVPDDAKAISITLTWHRRIDGRLARHPINNTLHWLDSPRLANFDMTLDYTDDSGQTGVIGESRSRIDNVEHIYIEQPPAGTFRLKVSRADDGYSEAWTYAAAWRVAR